MRHPTIIVAGALLLAGIGSAPAVAAPAGGYGSIRVTIAAPEGVPATIALVGRTRLVATKAPAGKSTVVKLSPPPGAYAVQPPGMVFGGRRYVARASQSVVGVGTRREVAVTVTYAADGAARDLHAEAVTGTSVSLRWSAPTGSRFVLRRTPGRTPVTLASLGTGVPVKGTTAVDKGVKAGRQYTYSLFTLLRGRWYGPLTVTAGTATASGVTYIANPATLLAEPADLVSAEPTGSAVRAVLRGGVPAPLVGSAVVLPVTASLPGGYLGVVASVGTDGRTLELTSGGLIDAFDFYELRVDDFVTTAAAPEIAAKAAASTAGCKDEDSTAITFATDVVLGGHFTTKVDKYTFLGQDVPTGASVDMGLRADVTGSAAVKTNGTFKCSINLPKLTRQLTVTPIPMAVTFTPVAEFSISAAAEVSDVGVNATASVTAKGSMTVKNGAAFSGGTQLSFKPLTPTVKANGSIGVKLGGSVLVGPGVTTEKAGVTAGVSGSLFPVDASFTPHFGVEDGRFNACTDIKAAFTRSLGLTAKAWLGSLWNYEATVSVDALKGSTEYGGSPWHLPSGCDNLVGEPGGSKDSLLGPGVDKVDDTTVGSPQQWGHVDGFVPGKKTWVLSTGNMAEALGDPAKFASTDLGRDGDDELTAFAGHPTFDAASYQVRLKPTGSTLHIRYVFASEEYPEYVGSTYNDVMAVRVNGKNCATVPGSTQAVSVNTINANENSQWYVDNADGAAGYATSMDGLTKPLTCSVPVTKGQEVTVQIAVADTSDRSWDSAIALVDGGIWSD